MIKTGRFSLILLLITALTHHIVLAQDNETELGAEQPAISAEQQAYMQWAEELWQSIDQQTGEIILPGDIAKLTVPDNFYYLNPKDTKKVLVEIWGNPEDSVGNVLGMIFPSNVTPFDDASWGVTIDYEEEGYIEDDGAADLDYAAMLAEMKQDTQASSEARVAQGYEPISLVGWAVQPFYDEQTKKFYWAKELQFGDNPSNTLNYNIRVLGRKGVLVMNFIAGMDQIDTINQNLDSVLAMAEFNQGLRYSDFDPDMDEVAAYGLGALVTGKVLAKTGFLAAAIIFLKKFGVVILIATGAFVRKIFTRNKDQKAD